MFLTLQRGGFSNIHFIHKGHFNFAKSCHGNTAGDFSRLPTRTEALILIVGHRTLLPSYCLSLTHTHTTATGKLSVIQDVVTGLPRSQGTRRNNAVRNGCKEQGGVELAKSGRTWQNFWKTRTQETSKPTEQTE